MYFSDVSKYFLTATLILLLFSCGANNKEPEVGEEILLTEEDFEKPEEAIADFNEAKESGNDEAEIYPEAGEKLLYEGIQEMEAGEYEKAIADFNKAIELGYDEVEVYSSRGTVKLFQGKNEEAIEDFNKAIEIDPEYAGAYLNRGVVKARLGNHEAAISDLKEALKRTPAQSPQKRRIKNEIQRIEETKQ